MWDFLSRSTSDHISDTASPKRNPRVSIKKIGIPIGVFFDFSNNNWAFCFV